MSADISRFPPVSFSEQASTKPSVDLRAAIVRRRRRRLARQLLGGALAYLAALAVGPILVPIDGGAGPLWAGYGIALGWMWARRGPAASQRLAVIAACTVAYGSITGESLATTLTYTGVLVVSLAAATVILARAGHIRALGITRDAPGVDPIAPLLAIPVGVALGVAVGWLLAGLTSAAYPTAPTPLLQLWLRDVTAMLTVGVPLMLFERGVLTFSVPRPVGPPSLLTGMAGTAERIAFGLASLGMVAMLAWVQQPLLTLVLILPVWAGLRFSSAGAVLCSLCVGLMVTLAAVQEVGMFALVPSETSRMVIAQGTIVVAVAFGLVLGLRQQEARTLAIAQDLAHRRARASEANLRAMLRRLDDGVVIADLDGTIRTVNPRACEIAGRTECQLLGRPLTDVWLDGTPPRPPEQHGAELRSRISRLIDRGRTQSVETGIERGDGRIVTTMSHFVPLTGDDPSHALAVVFTDVTEQRRYEHRLVTFARTVAHDIKGSIGAVGRWFEILDMTIETYDDLAPERRARLRSLTDQGTIATQELGDLLNGLLATTTERRPDLEVVDLAGCVRRQAWLLGLADAVELDDVPLILGRPAELEQLMANLLANSARYARAGRPRIRISARRVDPAGIGRVVVSVRDHGIGIPEDELDSVFAASRRGSNAEVTDGHGLGLAICADIARGHGGDIRAVVPEDGGPGVCIEVVLPAAPDPA